ncbi:MAG: hypothetical protein GXO20_04540 [Thermodesulfobacteria bacterium]|nr:hypothetical protein [Thermodesulfobacteriota bacterium]
MLLNLVRLRYRDNPVFLEITNISTQFSLSAGINADADVRETYPDTYSFGLGLSYAEKPTITFTPLHGEQFVKRLLSPIPLEHLILLLNSGWRVDRILRLCVQRIQDVKNAPTASGPTPDLKPEFEDFLELACLMQRLHRQKLIDFVYKRLDGKVYAGLLVHPEGRKHPDFLKLRRMLGLGDYEFYPITPEMALRNDRFITLQTRSLIGVLFYLSQGVEPPERDVEKGKVTFTHYPDGKPFDWRKLLGDLFVVRVSKKPPQEAAVAVRYRNHWFYIADDDLDTKSTFVLLGQLFVLEAGKEKGLVPLLTIPIGQ